ncbi:MAG: amino-acid N-acetyltransferase [Pseudomonadota bacterium]
MHRNDYAQWFRDSTPYISMHRGRTFVVLLEGEALAHPNLTNIVHDLALVHVLGARLVLVHGGRPQLDAALGADGSTFHESRRITHPAQLSALLGVLGELRARLEALFSTGLPTSPLRETNISVVSGNFVTARPVGIVDGVDHGLTGRVRRVDGGALRAILKAGGIGLLSPLGYSPSGQVFNLEASELATDVALSLAADKLIVFTEDGALVDEAGDRISLMSPAELHQHPASSSRRAASVLRAARSGIPSCQLVSWAEDGALIHELYTAGGSGTQIRDVEGSLVRPATAADVSSIVEVIRPLEEAGVLVRRDRDRLEAEIDHFLVADIDNNVVGCCAVYGFGAMAELACVAVHDSYRDGSPTFLNGIRSGSRRAARVGSSLLAAAEARARRDGAEALFVLTTQTRDWFLDHGFEAADTSALPGPKQAMYNYQRNASIMIKTLTREKAGQIAG